MARRQRRQQPGPPPPIQIIAPVVDERALKTAYDWFLLEPVVGISLVTEWYQNNIPALTYKKALTADQTKSLEKAEKARLLGCSAQLEPEKIQAFRTAIRAYERIWASKALPTIDAAFNAKDAGEVPANPEVPTQLLDQLNEAYKAFSITFRPTLDAEHDFVGHVIRIPKMKLDAMMAGPLLPAILDEAANVVRCLSIQTENGAAFIDAGQICENLPAVMSMVGAWAQNQNAGKLFHVTPAAVKAPRVPGAKQQRAPKVSGPVIPSVDPFGLFRSNTCKAAIAAVLGDRQVHNMTELKAVCTQYNSTFGPISHVLKDLAKANLTVTFSANRTKVTVS